MSAMSEALGMITIDEILTSGRMKIEQFVKNKTQDIFDRYQLGVTVTQVVILDALPVKEVEFSYNEVNKAIARNGKIGLSSSSTLSYRHT